MFCTVFKYTIYCCITNNNCVLYANIYKYNKYYGVLAGHALQPRLPAYISISMHTIEVERFIQNKQLYYINEILR